METEWKLRRKGGAFSEIAEKFHIEKRIASLICNRNIEGEENIKRYLEGDLEDLYDGILMKDMEKACFIIKENLAEANKIRIIGDYDSDGINATYILVKGLRSLGAVVDYAIPNRVTDGYGVNIELVKKACEDGIDTIITCDNGIAAREALEYGKSLGLTIIVTDHHEVPFEIKNNEKKYLLPQVDAIINPKQADCSYPFKGLCGAAIAYKLVETLFNFLGKDLEENVDDLLEHVAIATVTDIMELTDENRILVKEGIKRLKRTKSLGLLSLYEEAGIIKDNIGTYHLGFIIGPLLNATGRLEDATLALDLLFAKNEQKAKSLAIKIKKLNDERKQLTEEALVNAQAMIEEKHIYDDQIILLYLPKCHESLAGIVAGKIKEKYYKPTIILTDGKEGELKGSGRSIEAYDLYDGIAKCSHLLLRFGGHKQAAGLSLKKENFLPLKNKMNQDCELTPEDFKKKIVIDMELPFSEITTDFIEELALLEPFGNGNKKPIFALRDVTFLDTKVIGKNQNVLKAMAKDSRNQVIEAIYFNSEAKEVKEEVDLGKLDVLYYPSINEYRGRKSLQITIADYRKN